MSDHITDETIRPFIDVINNRMMDLASNHKITEDDYDHAYEDMIYFAIMAILRNRNNNDLNFEAQLMANPEQFFEELLMPTMRNVLVTLNRIWPNDDADIKYEINDHGFHLVWGNSKHMENHFDDETGEYYEDNPSDDSDDTPPDKPKGPTKQ